MKAEAKQRNISYSLLLKGPNFTIFSLDDQLLAPYSVLEKTICHQIGNSLTLVSKQ